MVVTLGNKTDDTLLTCLLLLLGGEQLQEGELLGGQASEHEGGGGHGQGGAGGSGQAEAGGGGEAGRGDRVQEEDWLRGGHGHQADGDSQSDQALQICAPSVKLQNIEWKSKKYFLLKSCALLVGFNG